jgi:mono/diheme cytochrome c family protein
MKKILVISIIVTALWSCSKKVTPTASTTKTDAIPAVVEKASAETLAAGEATYKANCGRCHGLKNPGSRTSARWVSVLDKMAPKAKLSDIEKQNVLAYLQANAKQ